MTVPQRFRRHPPHREKHIRSAARPWAPDCACARPWQDDLPSPALFPGGRGVGGEGLRDTGRCCPSEPPGIKIPGSTSDSPVGRAVRHRFGVAQPCDCGQWQGLHPALRTGTSCRTRPTSGGGIRNAFRGEVAFPCTATAAGFSRVIGLSPGVYALAMPGAGFPQGTGSVGASRRAETPATTGGILYSPGLLATRR